jgi:hypothetical protein
MKIIVLPFFLLTLCGVVCAQEKIEFVDEKIGCLDLRKITNQMIISSQEDYEKLKNFISPHPDCNTYAWPIFDFNERVLIGLLVNASGCSEPEYFKSVSKLNKEITFSIKVKEKGICRPLYQKMFWITIAKHKNVTINFKVETI